MDARVAEVLSIATSAARMPGGKMACQSGEALARFFECSAELGEGKFADNRCGQHVTESETRGAIVSGAFPTACIVGRRARKPLKIAFVAPVVDLPWPTRFRKRTV